MSANELVIRPLKHWDEYLAAEELERAVWQMPDWRDAVPANLLVVVAKSGGCVIGAFDGDNLVGFVFSFLGLDRKTQPPRLKQTSHMLGILPEYQSRKLGLRLKMAQRDYALAQNIDLVTWTYDPLLAVNANLNLVRLGAIARRYVPNAYGQMNDGLNAGIASDRFEAEWWLSSPRVVERLAREPQRSSWEQLFRAGAQEVFAIQFDSNGFPCVAKEWEPHAPRLIAEIPAQMGALKTAAPALAHEWRARTRDFFADAFDKGYACVDFVFAHPNGRAQPDGRERAAYVLSREDGFAK